MEIELTLNNIPRGVAFNEDGLAYAIVPNQLQIEKANEFLEELPNHVRIKNIYVYMSVQGLVIEITDKSRFKDTVVINAQGIERKIYE